MDDSQEPLDMSIATDRLPLYTPEVVLGSQHIYLPS
jgi:hypothetical protein